MDRLQIRQLIAKAIDVDEPDSAATMKTWPIIKLNFADANEVYQTIAAVYREYMNPSAASQASGMGGGFGGGGGVASAPCSRLSTRTAMCAAWHCRSASTPAPIA